VNIREFAGKCIQSSVTYQRIMTTYKRDHPDEDEFIVKAEESMIEKLADVMNSILTCYSDLKMKKNNILIYKSEEFLNITKFIEYLKPRKESVLEESIKDDKKDEDDDLVDFTDDNSPKISDDFEGFSIMGFKQEDKTWTEKIIDSLQAMRLSWKFFSTFSQDIKSEQFKEFEEVMVDQKKEKG